MPYKVNLSKQKISTLEQEISANWDQNRVFEKSIEQRPVENQFVLYDGPPFATGLPHYGHVLAGTLKDVFPRYQTMLGKRVERKWGWDCHGVPIEHQIQKQLKLDSHSDIKKYGIAEFNEACRNVVLTYANDWKKYVKRMGRFVDMENDYKTMDLNFMESIWAVFAKLHEKGLIYEDKRIIAYSPELGTPFSNFEAKQNYLTTLDPSIVMSFELKSSPNTFLLVWTTTPWTVPSNIAIAVNLDIQYVKATNVDGQSFILAKSALAKYQTHLPKQELGLTLTDVDPQTLINQHYQPMFDVLPKEEAETYYQILASTHVQDAEGTGLVHIAPAFGEDDFKLGKEHQLPALDFLDDHGKFKTLPVITTGRLNPDVNGIDFREANSHCIEMMKNNGQILVNEQIEHEYPHCWRTSKPLIYRAINSWFVKVSEIKDQMVKNNQMVDWYPENIGTGRFHNWLTDAHDWCISRDRYWGTPIPIWRNVEDPNDILVIGSVEELKSLTGRSEITDLHRHFIDGLDIEIDGKKFKRTEAVFDCWFESGAMPYAQQHYPFENNAVFEQTFPADFIAEGLDQTRGWFYTLMILSTALFDKPAFKNCVVNGILLGNDKKKMSKSLQNYPLLDTVFDEYGADAIRLVLLGSPATRAEPLAVKDEDFKDAVKIVLLPILNIYEFFAQSANAAKFSPEPSYSLENINHPLDQWLLYRVEQFRLSMTEAYDKYDLQKVTEHMRSFITDLSGWYIRHSRDRFEVLPGAVMTKNQQQAFHALHHALNSLALCIAPMTPFVSDCVYQALHGSKKSVHLQFWPQAMPTLSIQKQYDAIEKIRSIVHLMGNLRDKHKLPLKQALSSIYLDASLQDELLPLESHLKDILNVKNIIWANNKDELLDRKIQLNAKTLGKKYRNEYTQLRKCVENGDYVFENDQLIISGKTLTSDEYTCLSVPKKNLEADQDNGLWIIIDTQLSPALIEERSLRELYRHIQKTRGKMGLKKGEICEFSLEGAHADLAIQFKNEILFKTHSKFNPEMDSWEKSEKIKINSESRKSNNKLRMRRDPKLLHELEIPNVPNLNRKTF